MMMQVEHLEPRIRREQKKATDMADQTLQPEAARVPAGDIAVNRFVQRREDIVEQDGVDRDSYPIGKPARKCERGNRTQGQKYAQKHGDRRPGKLRGERLDRTTSALFEGASFQEKRFVLRNGGG